MWLSRPLLPADCAALGALKDVALAQKTPVRVLHRRSPLTRPRTVLWLRLEPVPGNPHFGMLALRCQAGTYVKEFVHGDFGRTVPSLGDLLGCQADILQLDVVNVDMKWI